MTGKVVITNEQKEKAVQIALDGGDYIAYLKECGSRAPGRVWEKYMKKMHEEDPDTYMTLMKMQKPEPKEEEAKQLPEAGEEDRAAEAVFPARPMTINGIEPLEPAALYSRVLEDGTFKKVNGLGMMLSGMNYQIILSAYQWFRLSEEILVALRQLKADKLEEAPDEE